MYGRILLAGIATGIAGSILIAPAALAGNDVYAAIGIQDKGELRPGQHVRVMASCHNEKTGKSEITHRTVTSSALVAGPLEGESPASVDARIKPNAKPGKHTLSFECRGRTVTGSFELLPAKRRPGTTPRKAAVAQEAGDQVRVKPKGAPETGGGATAAPDTLGQNLDWLSVGGAAVGGGLALAAGAVVFVNRRRQRLGSR
ncbi:hypothetical protein JOF53_002854 [Crossiella equi]|uniref:Sortase n=1 Tax=Crossiella equi TaxID=130796 RepID=A0ABS5ACF2_9PSEU|nr:hypothetical protein [Crossiella equi]MBP2473982.1 hypothetical protein [Crossiella equi]